jgi:hypothetical protein
LGVGLGVGVESGGCGQDTRGRVPGRVPRVRVRVRVRGEAVPALPPHWLQLPLPWLRLPRRAALLPAASVCSLAPPAARRAASPQAPPPPPFEPRPPRTQPSRPPRYAHGLLPPAAARHQLRVWRARKPQQRRRTGVLPPGTGVLPSRTSPLQHQPSFATTRTWPSIRVRVGVRVRGWGSAA